MRRRMTEGMLPAPLVALLGAVLVTCVAWAIVLPPWQAPDENAHFAYVQSLVDRGERPGEPGHPVLSTEQRLAGSYSNADQAAGSREAKLTWAPAVERSWRAREERLTDADREDGGGANPALTTTPLYYWLQAPAYAAADSRSIFDRLYAMRLWSALLLLVTVVGAWLLAGELLGPARLPRLVVAGVTGLLPMSTFISSTVNPDALLLPLWSFVLWLGVRALRTRPSVPLLAALLGCAAVAVMTKATSAALIPAVAFVVVVAFARILRSPIGRARRVALVAGGAAAVAVAVVVVAGLLNSEAVERDGPEVPDHKRAFLSYLWQFYLPRLGFQNEVPRLPDDSVFTIWIKTTWASFGWLEVQFPDPVYWALAAFTAVVIVGGAAALARTHPWLGAPAAVFLGLAVIGLLSGLHLIEFAKLEHGEGAFVQGRYLLPIVPVFGVLVAAALRSLPARLYATGAGAVLSGLAVLQLASLGIVLGRFYA